MLSRTTPLFVASLVLTAVSTGTIADLAVDVDVEGSTEATAVSVEECEVQLVSAKGFDEVIELDWIRNTMLRFSPCAIKHYGAGAGPVVGQAHVLMVLAKNMGLVESAPGQGSFHMPPKMQRALETMRSFGMTVGAIHLSDEGCRDALDLSTFDYVFKNYACPNKDALATAGAVTNELADEGKGFELSADMSMSDGEGMGNAKARWFPLGPNKGFEVQVFGGGEPLLASHRTHLCNFLGQVGPLFPQREAIMQKLNVSALGNYSASSTRWAQNVAAATRGKVESHPACVVHGTDGFNNGDKRSYSEVLSQSAFTLCPRGMHEETFRLWEALEAGSIPIIKAHASWAPLGDDHPLPTVASWDEVGALLAKFSATDGSESTTSDEGMRMGKIDQLQREVAAWYLKFKQKHAEEFAAVISQAEYLRQTNEKLHAPDE